MFSPRQKKSQKNGTKQMGLEKQWQDEGITSPTSVCSSGLTFSRSSTQRYGVIIDYGYGDESTTDDGYGDHESDVSTRDLYRQDTQPKRRTMKNYVLLADEYNEESPEHRGSASRRTPRRTSSLKQIDQPRRPSIQFTGEKEVALPNTGEKVRRSISISFDEGVQVQQVAQVMDLAENPQLLWFQDHEYDEMRNKCYNLVDLVEGGVLKEGTKLCIRGLEGMMEEQWEKTTALRRQALDSVLDEQDRQVENHIFDDQALASALMLSSIESRSEAKRRAKQDEAEVKKYLSSTRRMCRRLSC